MTQLDSKITNLFQKDRKCIINADLDGLLSGMVLHKFLGWEIVGFSSCSGKADDELWLFDKSQNLTECVFVDLPVYIESYSTIDQHFIAFDKESVERYKCHDNKVNPNIIRERVLRTESGYSEYTVKYPFGTIHFIIAVLENMGLINENYCFDFDKQLENFDLADLILRADRVVGNTFSYTNNCLDWMNWLTSFGGKNTNILFNKVKSELLVRNFKEKCVEDKMKQLGCDGIDGDCSNLFRNKDYDSLKNYFEFLSTSMDMEMLPIKEITDFGKLKGKRLKDKSIDFFKKESLKYNVFSFALVMKNTLSITYIKEDDNND